jgi:hypothetical protein
MSFEDLTKEFEDADTPAHSMEEMDNLVKEMNAKRAEYEAAKEISNKLHAEWDAMKAKVVASLKAAGKSKYWVDGIGTAYIINKLSVKMPTTLDRKQELFNFIREQGGPEALLSFATIHHQTLNAWYNETLEKDPSKRIPGLDEPTHEETLGFRKESKK